MQQGEDGARERPREEAAAMTEDEEFHRFLSGDGTSCSLGLFAKSSTRPLPEGTMTRQRRRTEARRRQG